ncbi:MAG: D-2-hydroxyacid dehydrogenase [Bauldia sp.]|nr:D-2-hydroxyacid dehydrogenase [Bauldia sp.]
MPSSTILVIARPGAGFLPLLDRLPPEAETVIGIKPEDFAARAAEADVLLNCMEPLAIFREVFLMAPNLKWVHSMSVGVENSLFPELIASPVPLTNARGVFSSSLAEFAILGALYFSKKVGEMRAQQVEHRWVDMDVDELRGKTMGIVSYGSIGQATATLAKAFGMTVWAHRRRPELCDGDPLVDRAFGPEGLRDMLAGSDYVVVCSPLTPETRGFFGEAEIAAMKPSAVFINVGRGAVVDEPALAAALAGKRIRGAALDVFATEPLPADSPFWDLDNVLVSPHSADHTPGWIDSSMLKFVENFGRYASGESLLNPVDKKAGY